MVDRADPDRHGQQRRLGEHEVAVVAGHEITRGAEHQRRVGDAGQRDHGHGHQGHAAVATEQSASHRARSRLVAARATGQDEEGWQGAEPGRDREQVEPVEDGERRPAI